MLLTERTCGSFKRPFSALSRVSRLCFMATLFVFGPQRAMCLDLSAIASQPGKAPACSKQGDENIQVLEPGKPLERTLAGGQAHVYPVKLAAGQYLHLVVDQRGVDVVVRLLGPDGKSVAEIDSPNGQQGPEPIFFIAQWTGTYRLEIRCLEKQAPTGKYEISIRELRAEKPQDKYLVAAEKASAEAGVSLLSRTAESRRRAIDQLKESLRYWSILGDRDKEAKTLLRIGNLYDALGEKKQALDFFNRSLSLWKELGSREGEAQSLGLIALYYDDAGEQQKALDILTHQVLPLFEAMAKHKDVAETLHNIASVYQSMGEYQKALDYYYQALPLIRAEHHLVGEATALQNIGMVYSALGEKDTALTLLSQALPIRRASGDRVGEAYTLGNLGRVYHDLGEHQKALEFYTQALQFWRTLGGRRGESLALTDLGSLYSGMGDYQKALTLYHEAHQLMKILANRLGEAKVLRGIAAVYMALGDDQKALDYCTESLGLERAVNDKQGEANTLSQLARLKRRSGDLIEAQNLIERAINLTEPLRLRVTNPELRASYFASMQGLYEFYIDLLIQRHKLDPSAGHSAAAFGVSERARARSLLDLLTESKADIQQGVDPTLLQRERIVQQLFNAKAERQMRLLNGKYTEEQAAVAKKEVDDLATEYQQLMAQIKATSPKYAAITQPQPLSLQEVQQQVLDPDTLLLEYFLGDERSYLWAVSPDSAMVYEIPKRADIENAAIHFYNLLTARNRYEKAETPQQRQSRLTQAVIEYPQAAAKLSRMLLGPVASLLGSKRLVLIADGALQYIPFAALPEPGTTAATNNRGQPLIVNREIINLPSASTMAVLRQEFANRKACPKAVAVIADPVFDKDDSRITQAAKIQQPQATTDKRSDLASSRSEIARSLRDIMPLNSGVNLPRLIFSRQEAKAIISFAPVSKRKQALDFEASKAIATGAELGQYRIVHFAAHGLLNGLHPELSGVVLSLVNEKGEAQDGFLRLHEIYNLKLPAELVVLSACQTGLGKEIKREGMIGLTRGFMYAGTARVVASLWKVDDEATAELMKRFYEGMLRRGKRPTAALREAQIRMLKQKDWQQPYFWAAFTIQGEWR